MVGFDPSGMSYMWEIQALRSLRKSPNWEKRDSYGMGWSKDEFQVGFRKSTGFMTMPVDTIIMLMDYLVNTIG